MNAELCHFDSNEAAQGSLLAKWLFQSKCVRAVLISHDQVTITKTTTVQWPVIGKMIGAAIRDHLATGEPAVSEVVRRNIPPADQICQVVQQALDRGHQPVGGRARRYRSTHGHQGQHSRYPNGRRLPGLRDGRRHSEIRDRNSDSRCGSGGGRRPGRDRPRFRTKPLFHSREEVVSISPGRAPLR